MSSTYPVIKGSLLSSEHYTWNTADSVGRGASAVVFLGRHKSRGTVVAVKVFHDHVALGYKQDDLRELELLRTLNHQNIIRLLAIERELSSQKTVLVTEYCEGGSLHQMLDQPLYYYGLPEHEYKLVLFHVSDGMQYLREKNVIHRDIKPGNIMRSLTQEGFSVYKLTDFGAARNLNEDESFQSLYGTEEYLYPGVYERAVLKLPTAQSFDAKVDLWSLGVTFYHTATGELPFQPFGGRQNRETMFQIITQKETGVISGVQTCQNGPIVWRKQLPETSPLSSGLKSVVVPLLARLMEPEPGRMIPYETFFSFVEDLKQKMTVDVFHFGKCKDLKVYAHPTTTLSGLQDFIAELTDIPAEDQILLVGGRSLDEVVDPMTKLAEYPPHLLHDSLYLFQKEMSEASRLPKLDIPAFPEFSAYSDMDSDARLAHSCAARGELIKRFQKGICQQQQSLMNGLLYFRLYVESRLSATKPSHEFMTQLMTECELHVKTFFTMSAMMKDVISSLDREHADIETLDSILQDTVIRQVYKKADERMREIEQYRDVLLRRLEDVKVLAGRVTAGCREEQCHERVVHHLTVITGVQSRFRRDKSVKHQMTKHDENIHQFERQKLQEHCVTLKSIFTDHCLGQLEKVYRSALQVGESLTRCLARVMKVEKNINSVLNCQKLLSQKLIKLVGTLGKLKSVEDSGFGESKLSGLASYSKPSTAPAKKVNSFLPPNLSDSVNSVSNQTQELTQKLAELQESLDYNSQLIRGLDDCPLQSSGSLSRRIEAMNLTLAEIAGDFQHHKHLPSSTTRFEPTALTLQHQQQQQQQQLEDQQYQQQQHQQQVEEQQYQQQQQHQQYQQLEGQEYHQPPPEPLPPGAETTQGFQEKAQVLAPVDLMGSIILKSGKNLNNLPGDQAKVFNDKLANSATPYLIPMDSRANFLVRLPSKGGARLKTSTQAWLHDPNFQPPKPFNPALQYRGEVPKTKDSGYSQASFARYASPPMVVTTGASNNILVFESELADQPNQPAVKSAAYVDRKQTNVSALPRTSEPLVNSMQLRTSEEGSVFSPGFRHSSPSPVAVEEEVTTEQPKQPDPPFGTSKDKT